MRLDRVWIALDGNIQVKFCDELEIPDVKLKMNFDDVLGFASHEFLSRICQAPSRVKNRQPGPRQRNRSGSNGKRCNGNSNNGESVDATAVAATATDATTGAVAASIAS